MAPAKNQARPDWGDHCVWGVDGKEGSGGGWAGQGYGGQALWSGVHTSFSQVLWPPAERVLAGGQDNGREAPHLGFEGQVSSCVGVARTRTGLCPCAVPDWVPD